MKKALITYLRNEALILPIWLNHYLKSFEGKDIYVLDNVSTDNSVELLLNAGVPKCNITQIQIDQRNFTNQWLNDRATDLQNKLLDDGYECVVLAELDEFLVIDETKSSSWDDFLTSLKNQKTDTVRALGYDVLHNFKSEQDLDLTKPLLAQRELAMVWRPELHSGKQLFSKPVLSLKKFRWSNGGHDIKSAPHPLYQNGIEINLRAGPVIDDRLVLFHMNLCDIKFSTSRRQSRVPKGEIALGGDRLGIGDTLIGEIQKFLSHRACGKIPEHLKNSF